MGKKPFLLKLSLLLGALSLVAAPLIVSAAPSTSWDFTVPSDYNNDSGITISGGQAQLTPRADWYDASWNYRKAVTVSSSAALTNYQVKVTVTYNASMQQDFDDIRFTASDGTTALSYWLQDKTDSTAATFWVKVPAVAAGDTTVYMYYGNSSAISASNGNNTFILFDDFSSGSIDTNKWTAQSSANAAVSIKPYEVQHFTTLVNGGQGLVMDGTSVFFGKDNGAGVDGTIYKYDYAGNAISNFPGPAHAAMGDTRDDHGTLLFSSGSSDVPQVWEMDKSTGTKIRSWDFTGVDYGRGAGVTYKGPGQIYFFTSSASDPYAFKIREVTLNDDGSYVLGQVWAASGLGLPQGLKYKDGFLYYMVGDSMGTTHKLQLNGDGSITTVQSYNQLIASEPEGLTFDGTNWYYASSDKTVFRLILNDTPAARFIAYNTNHYAYLQSNTAYAAPVTMGTRTHFDGAYPGALWLADTGGSPNVPDQADNMAGLGHLSIATTNLYGRQRNATNQSQQMYTGILPYTSSHNYEMKWSGSAVSYYQDTAFLGTSSSTVPTVSLRPTLGGVTAVDPNGFNVSTYWVYLRAYAVTEPAVSTATTPQTRYSSANPSVQPTAFIPFDSLAGFSETATKNGGEITYQLSNDGGTTWYWYSNGWATTPSGYAQSNTADVVASHIATLPTGPGKFLFRAYLHSDGWQLVQLDTVALTTGGPQSSAGGTLSGGGGTPWNPVVDTSACRPEDAFSMVTGARCATAVDSSTTPPPASGIVLSANLKFGITADQVKLLQQYLNVNGYTVALAGAGSLGSETTYFGPVTKAAVMKFQKAHGLTVDGIVGPATRLLINSK